jgi:SAM-dependent methyltransferase
MSLDSSFYNILSLFLVFSLQGLHSMEQSKESSQDLSFSSYKPENYKNIESPFPLVSEQITPCDLAEINTLSKFAHPKFRKTEILELGVKFLQDKRITRANKNSQYGCNFPLNHDVLQELMPKVKGKVCCDLAYGRGYNGFLLGLAGAQKIYMIDIDSEVMEGFKEKIEHLPASFKEKFEFITQDIFLDLPKTLSEKFDFIYCRNFIHFLTEEKIKLFFNILKNLLKPEGEIILSGDCKKDFKESGWSFREKTKLGYFLNKKEFIKLEDFMIQENTPCLENVDPLQYKEFFPAIVSKGKLAFDQDTMRSLPADVLNFFKDNIRNIISSCENLSLKDGTRFKILCNHKNYVSPPFFAQVLEENGFCPSKGFLTHVGTGESAKEETLKSSEKKLWQLTVFARLKATSKES